VCVWWWWGRRGISENEQEMKQVYDKYKRDAPSARLAYDTTTDPLLVEDVAEEPPVVDEAAEKISKVRDASLSAACTRAPSLCMPLLHQHGPHLRSVRAREMDPNAN
jgi:hypothetical protein